MGPIFVQPVPRAVLDALVEVEVKVEDVGTSGFQLTFSIDKQSPLQILFLLTGGMPLLFLRVILVATVNGVANVLMDGVVTNNQISPGDKGSNSTLTITGKDLTEWMNQSNWSGFPYPACPAEARVALMLAKYAFFGIIPIIIPSVLIDVPIPIDQIPSQQGTDLEYIRFLAERVGYVFYLDPGPVPGTNKAYWGPQIKVGPVQPALNIDMDAYTNVESLHFTFDQQKNKIPLLYIYNSETGFTIPIPIPPITPLNPPLGLIPPLPTNFSADLKPFRDDLSKKPIPQAIMIGLAAAAEYAEAVTGEGSLDVTRYGGVLNARQLVGVRGAGPAFDGLYYVKSVTHKIKRGEYKQKLHADSQRPGLDRFDGVAMSAAAKPPPAAAPTQYYGKVSRAGDREHRSRADRPRPGAGARRAGRASFQLGDALRPGRRHSGGLFRRAAHRLASVGRVRAGRSRLPDLDRRLLGPRRRRADLRHCAARRSRLARTSCCRPPGRT